MIVIAKAQDRHRVIQFFPLVEFLLDKNLKFDMSRSMYVLLISNFKRILNLSMLSIFLQFRLIINSIHKSTLVIMRQINYKIRNNKYA